MSTLCVSWLDGGSLKQPLTVGSERIQISGLRLWLYVHNLPAGTFIVELETGGAVVATSSSFSATDMQTALSTANTYFHMHHVISFTNPVNLHADTTYSISLRENAGYAWSSSQWIGWVHQHENRWTPVTYTPDVSDDANEPLGFQLFNYRRYGNG